MAKLLLAWARFSNHHTYDRWYNKWSKLLIFRVKNGRIVLGKCAMESVYGE